MKRLISLCLCLLLALSAVSGMAIPLAVSAEDNAAETAIPNSYVPGLVAWYDGTQNTRAGEDTSSTVWEDLISGYDLPVTVNATYTDQDIMFSTASRGDVVSLAKTAKTNRHNFFEIYLSSDFMNIANDENVDFSTLFNGAEFNYTMGFGSNEQGLTMDVIYNFK